MSPTPIWLVCGNCGDLSRNLDGGVGVQLCQTSLLVQQKEPKSLSPDTFLGLRICQKMLLLLGLYPGPLSALPDSLAGFGRHFAVGGKGGKGRGVKMCGDPLTGSALNLCTLATLLLDRTLVHPVLARLSGTVLISL